jgi:uncharacterized protein YdhG (YjbR/CyaY superfamily)
MDNENKELSTIDEYIESFLPEVRERLSALRKTVKEAAPEAEEKISYQMPAYFLNGRLVYFAGFKNHIGFYPLTNAMEVFKDELKPFKTGKGSVQFQHSEPFPIELIKKIIEFRVRENREK